MREDGKNSHIVVSVIVAVKELYELDSPSEFQCVDENGRGDQKVRRA